MYPMPETYLHTTGNNTTHQRLQSSSSSSTEESNHSYKIDEKAKRRQSLEKNRLAGKFHFASLESVISPGTDQAITCIHSISL